MKLHDHEYRLPGGRRLQIDHENLRSQLQWLPTQVNGLMRVLEPEATVRTFGSPDDDAAEPDQVRIEHLALRIVATVEVLIDWAAELRNADVSDSLADAVEQMARMADLPILDIQKFVRRVVEEAGTLPEQLASGKDVRLQWTLKLDMDPEVMAAFDRALDKAS